MRHQPLEESHVRPHPCSPSPPTLRHPDPGCLGREPDPRVNAPSLVGEGASWGVPKGNRSVLNIGEVLDIATVVRALYHRSRIKELPILERKLYDSALKLLVDEISFSLQKEKEEVEELVLSKMEVN